jgi:hypothetical protein
MKHLKNFSEFVNESHLPFEIEKTLRLGGFSFERDAERSEEVLDDDNRFDEVDVYVANDRNGGTEWVVTAGIGGSTYYLDIAKDDTIVWSSKYPRSQQAHFNQDCMNSIGFLPDFA